MLGEVSEGVHAMKVTMRRRSQVPEGVELCEEWYRVRREPWADNDVVRLVALLTERRTCWR